MTAPAPSPRPIVDRVHRLGPPPLRLAGLGLALALGASVAASAPETTPAQQLQRFTRQAGGAGQADAGRSFFTRRHGSEWSCASCHGDAPTHAGQHASTGKRLDPLAPAANPRSFTDEAKVDKWFRRNCNDVLQRECTAREKADVIAYLMSLKP